MTTALFSRPWLYTSDSRKLVSHGSDMYVARPTARTVLWVGSVIPAFADPTIDLLAQNLVTTPTLAGEWTPDLITGIRWWNPRNAASFTEVGGSVTAWIDQTGAYTFTGASGSRPTRVTVGGTAAVALSGSQCLTSTDAIADGEALSATVVACSTLRDDDGGTSPVSIFQYILALAYTAGVGNPQTAVRLLKQTVPRSLAAIVTDTAGASVESIRGSDETEHVLELDRQPDTIQVIVDGQEGRKFTGSTGVPTGFVRMVLGATATTSTPTSFLTGYVRDVFVKPGGLTSSQRAALRAYVARHAPVSLVSSPYIVSSDTPFKYNPWPVAATHTGAQKYVLGWSSRPGHTLGPGGGLILRATADMTDPAAWSTPINLRDLIPTLVDATVDLTFNGLGTDGSGGLLAIAWFKSPTVARGLTNLIFRCRHGDDPAVLSSWFLAARPAFMPAQPDQVNAPIVVAGYGLVIPFDRDHFSKYAYGWIHVADPEDLNTFTVTTISSTPAVDGGATTPGIIAYANEWSYVAKGNKWVGIGHRHIFYEQTLPGGGLPLVQIMGSSTVAPVAWVETNITGGYKSPAWTVYLPATNEIEVVYFNRLTGEMKVCRGDFDAVYASPLAWGPETVLETVSSNAYNSGADSGYPASALLRGQIGYGVYDGHKQQGTGPIAEQANVVFMHRRAY